MIETEILNKAMARFRSMPFFPTADPAAIAVIGDDLVDMVANGEQLTWLAKRVQMLYRDWPGMREVRAVYCSRYRPKDGAEVYSTAYDDGIPAEVEPPPLRPAPPQLAAPAAEVQLLENQIREIAAEKTLGPRPPAPAKPAPSLPEGIRPITAEDIARAVNEIREARAREELRIHDEDKS